ncbi:hypothetical protein A33O_18669 [Nitratireductor aquibiodomus RA22]|uniref:Uncharacterized protein n=2 Tax=Nitratireductor aquibiodomus TaxID=204799 RepID=I5BSZ4_9HYPH|nr:hypothetical protein A33O_18669 [Nitratireductor aquibiodomus RA22]
MTRLDETAARASGSSAQRQDVAILGETSRRYERCHPDDTFADLARRSSFSKEDRRLLEDWLAATALDIGATDG